DVDASESGGEIASHAVHRGKAGARGERRPIDCHAAASTERDLAARVVMTDTEVEHRSIERSLVGTAEEIRSRVLPLVEPMEKAVLRLFAAERHHRLDDAKERAERVRI